MLSSVVPSPSQAKYSQMSSTKTQTYPAPAPNRFSVHVFKGPTFSSFAPPSSQNYDHSYRLEAGQTPHRYSSRYDDISKRFSAPSEPSKASRVSSSAKPPPVAREYEPSRPRTATNYSIYPNVANGTYIYEQSLCSKSDIYSSSEYESTMTFSPAMSTDSTLTLKSPEPSERALETSHSSSPLYNSFPAHAPLHVPRSSGDRSGSTNRLPHDGSTGSGDEPRSRAGSSVAQAQTGAPIRLSTPSSGSVQPHDSTPSFVTSHSSGYDTSQLQYSASLASESEVDARDLLAQANAEYNIGAASSASYYAATAESSSGRDSRSPPVLHDHHRSTTRSPPREQLPKDNPPRQNYTSRYVENSPESFVDDTIYRVTSSNTDNATGVNLGENRYSRVPTHPDSLSTESEEFLPAFAQDDWDRGTSNEYTQRTTWNTAASQASHLEPGGVPSRTTATSYYNISEDAPDRRQERSLPDTPPTTRQQSSHAPSGPRPDSRTPKILQEPRDGQRTEDVELKSNAMERSPPSLSRGYTTQRQVEGSYTYGSRPNSTNFPSFTNTEYHAEDRRADSRAVPVLTTSPEQQATNRQRKASFATDTSHRSTTPYQTSTQQHGSSLLFATSPATQYPIPGVQYDNRASPAMPSYQTANMSPSGQADYDSGNLTDPMGRPRSNNVPRSLSSIRLSPQNQTAEKFSSSHHSLNPLPAEGGRLRGNNHTQVQENGTNFLDSERNRHQRNSPTTSHTSSVSPQYIDPSSYPQPARSAAGASGLPPLASSLVAPDRSRTPFIDTRRSAHPEPLRRHSDGDRPTSTASVSPRSAAAPHGKAYNSTLPINQLKNGPVDQAIHFTPEPQRRFSDGDQSNLTEPIGSGRTSAPVGRCVRWNENLVCPSPIFASQRRKGWFNRRGDQLWTNDGAYKPAPAGQQYPPDLDEYPEYGEGWMNEECVRINMSHRLIPKPPLRSALKQTKA